jgi:Na+-driven multidrug efflux pump
MIPSMFFRSQYDVVRKYLEITSRGFFIVVLDICASLLQILFVYAFAKGASLGLKGVALASVMSSFILFIVSNFYASCFR